MSKDEIKTLKNELYKEIKEVEDKINQKLLKQFEKDEENISEYIQKFNKMFKRGESLLDSMSTQIINFDKISELENFRNKIDSMVISHEIRINNNIKEIQDIKFKYDREITENLTVPGFVGPSCKYKTISNYISSNIDEISKMKIENEVHKKDSKDLRKKVDEIIKTCLNLVDNSNTKFLQYVNTKTKNLEQFLNLKLGEFSDKIIDFKSLLMTQKNAKELTTTIMEELQNNTYTKKEIDDKITDLLNNNKENKMIFTNDIILVKISVEKIEKEIIEIKKNIKEIKNKIKQTIQIQHEIMKKNNLLMKTMKYNTSERNLYANSIQKANTNLSISSPRKKTNEEEKQMKYRNSLQKGKSKTIRSLEELGIKNNIQHQVTDTKIIKEVNDIIKLSSSININSSLNKIIENSPKNISRNSKFLSNSSTQNEKEKFRTSLSNINSEEIKDTISDNENDNENYNDNDLNFFYPNNISINKNDTIEKDEKYNNIISTPNNAKVKSLMNNNINDKKENINKRSICLLKKLNNNKNGNDIISNLKLKNNNNTNGNNIIDLLSFGISQNQKSIIMPADNDKNIGESNNPIVQVMNEDLIKDKIDYLNNKSPNNNFINNKIIQKEKRNSIHKLAAIALEEKASTLFPNVGEFSSRSSKGKHNKTITPLIKNIFQQSYQMNKTNKNLNDEFPVKIKAAFGRTGYTLYDKKEEGINYLINKGIENRMKRHKSHSTVVNFKLCPAARIKVYNNI